MGIAKLDQLNLDKDGIGFSVVNGKAELKVKLERNVLEVLYDKFSELVARHIASVEANISKL